jgi:membrane-bound serine protease (ClpP class)
MSTHQRATATRTWVRRSLAVVAMLLGLLALVPTAAGQTTATGGVVVLRIDGMINPITERYLLDGISDAEASGAGLVVLELDTPGGLLDATQRMTGAMLASRIPVAVYVSPRGARAASAGTFITMAGHVAVMAPDSRIGAATPVGGSGEDIGDDLRQKVINDTVVYARSIAEARGRNADWAESAIRDAAVVGANEAVELDVVDLIASDRPALLTAIDGRTVEVDGGEVLLETADAVVDEQPMSPIERLFMAIADPNIALLLLSLGGIGLYFELANPGAMIPGIIGVILLLLAFLSLGMLPLNLAGLALIGVGLLLLGAEVFVASGGILGVGGVAAFALGALLLIDERQSPFLEVSRPLIAALTLTMGGFVLVAVRGVMRTRSRPVAIGGEELRGRLGQARAPDEVFVMGELWRARLEDDPSTPLTPGAPIRVVRRDGLVLIVEPAEAPTTAETP